MFPQSYVKCSFAECRTQSPGTEPCAAFRLSFLYIHTRIYVYVYMFAVRSTIAVLNLENN